jgi:hypothetical protein
MRSSSWAPHIGAIGATVKENRAVQWLAAHPRFRAEGRAGSFQITGFQAIGTSR